MRSNLKQAFRAVLEAVAAGDAMGMATEGRTREDIKRLYPVIDGFLPIQPDSKRRDEIAGTITDDMGQNLYLIKAYLADRSITIENSVRGLEKWLYETNGERFIGPSSGKALAAIREGESVYIAGEKGTSCGAVMRMPSVVLCTNLKSPDALEDAVKCACIPTHNTAMALIPAFSYAYALREALLGKSAEAILAAAIREAENKEREMPQACGPSCARRLGRICADIGHDADEERFLDDLYYVYGSTLTAIETYTSAIAISLFAGTDVYRAIRMSVGLGGDTDSIAALSGALSAARARGHNIPEPIIRTISDVNHLDCAQLADEIVGTFQ